jgi:ribosomal protein S7
MVQIPVEVAVLVQRLERIELALRDLVEVAKQTNNSLVAVAMGKERGSHADFGAV